MAGALDGVADLRLTEELRNLIDGAGAAGKPLAVAYVAADGAPHVSLRGTVQTYGTSALALWSRSLGLPDSLAANPRVALLYQDLPARTFLQLSGTAGVVTDDTVRDHVFTRSPEREQAQDPEQRGVAVVIELAAIEGLTPAGPVRMRSRTTAPTRP